MGDEWEGARCPPVFFGTKTFNFRSNALKLRSVSNILGLIGLMFSAHGKQTNRKKTNKHAYAIFLLSKNAKFRIFADGSLKVQQQGCWIR